MVEFSKKIVDKTYGLSGLSAISVFALIYSTLSLINTANLLKI